MGAHKEAAVVGVGGGRARPGRVAAGGRRLVGAGGVGGAEEAGGRHGLAHGRHVVPRGGRGHEGLGDDKLSIRITFKTNHFLFTPIGSLLKDLKSLLSVCQFKHKICLPL